ncbi:hypothetical protein [Deinococcus kurensis]|uniref:hypothetical protein n=1 Tax=Deinococcus kurensis TaxID=2662757 RepID=UPI0012D34E05|nr:hypothetical protein [Deinococcus kurensis]
MTRTAARTVRPVRLPLALVLVLLTAPQAQAAAPHSVSVPRERISLSCVEGYAQAPRLNFLLADETYPRCVLRLPLALRERWPAAQTFFVVPRVAATLYAHDTRGKGHWLPLAPLVNPGDDPLHRAVPAGTYRTLELGAALGQPARAAGDLTPDTVSVGGKVTVCAAPAPADGPPCVTFDIAARYRVYTRT